MPLFAFANAGVRILGNIVPAVQHPVSLGVAFGLFVGKPLGICFFAWLSEKARLASRPGEISWSQIFGASCLCGIGFTMALFIATLAFGEGTLLDMSKIGIVSPENSVRPTSKSYRQANRRLNQLGACLS